MKHRRKTTSILRSGFFKVLLFFDVVATFCPAVLVTLNLEEFETIAHQIEYLNELTMAFVNLVLLASLLRKPDSPQKGEEKQRANKGVRVTEMTPDGQLANLEDQLRQRKWKC